MLGEPQLLGLKVQHALIEDAIVAHEGSEAVRVAVDPVHHPAAVRGAETQQARRVNVRVVIDQEVEAVEDIGEGLASVAPHTNERTKTTISIVVVAACEDSNERTRSRFGSSQ